MKGRNTTTAAKADTGHFENPADAAAAQKVAAGLASGEDVFGDNDDDDGTPMPGAGAAPAQAAAPANADTQDLDAGDSNDDAAGAAADAEADAARQAAEASRQADNTEAQAAVPPPVPQFKTKSTAELADAKKALLAEKADAFEKYSVGTMTAAEYSEVDSRVMMGLMDIASEGALAQANTQTALNVSEMALADVKKFAKEQGLIDYDTDQEAGPQFDNVVDMLAKDPKVAALPDAEFFTRAHNLVLAMRGHAPPATASTVTVAAAPGKPAARADAIGPITLRTIPAAATPNAGGGVAEQLGRLNGLDFEEAVGGMGRQQRDAWLDS